MTPLWSWTKTTQNRDADDTILKYAWPNGFEEQISDYEKENKDGEENGDDDDDDDDEEEEEEE